MNDLKHTFSIEMKSKDQLTTISISERPNSTVVFEGDLGKLVNLNLIDDQVLVLLGTNGTLRLSLTETQILNALKKTRKVTNKLCTI